MERLRIRMRGADLSPRALGFSPPIPVDLQYFNFFGGTAGNSGRNLAPGKPPGVVIGAPEVGAHWITTTHLADYIRTQVAQTSVMTLFAVARLTADDGQGHFLWSNSNGPAQGYPGSTFGTSLYWETGNPGDNAVAARFAAARDNGNGTSTAVIASSGSQPSPQTSPYLLIGTLEPDGKRSVINVTTSGLTASITDEDPLALGPPLNIGSKYAGTGGNCCIYAAGAWSRALSGGERTLLHGWLQTYYAGRGISI